MERSAELWWAVAVAGGGWRVVVGGKETGTGGPRRETWRRGQLWERHGTGWGTKKGVVSLWRLRDRPPVLTGKGVGCRRRGHPQVWTGNWISGPFFSELKVKIVVCPRPLIYGNEAPHLGWPSRRVRMVRETRDAPGKTGHSPFLLT